MTYTYGKSIQHCVIPPNAPVIPMLPQGGLWKSLNFGHAPYVAVTTNHRLSARIDCLLLSVKNASCGMSQPFPLWRKSRSYIKATGFRSGLRIFPNHLRLVSCRMKGYSKTIFDCKRTSIPLVPDWRGI